MPYQLNVESLDPQSFGVMDKAGRRTFPARFFPSAFGASDVRVEDFWTGEKMTIPLGSRVGGATPASQAALITALRNVVGKQSVIDATMARLFVDQYGNRLPSAWYDPSDLSTMRSGSQGSDPITVSGEQCSVMLDKRLGLALGPELVTNGSLDSGMSGWTIGSDANQVIPTWAAGQVTLTRGAGGAAGFSQYVTTVVGQTYKVTFSCPADSPTSAVLGGSLSSVILAPGSTKSAYFLALSTSSVIQFWPLSSGTVAIVDSISCVHIAGNHAYQATSASRPIFRDVAGVRYLEFDGVDDYLRATFTIAQPIDRISGLQQVTSTPDDRLFGGVATSSGSLYQTGTSPRMALFSGAATFSIGDLAVGVNGVVTERHNGASSRLTANNVAYSTGDAGTGVPGGITIGASDLSANPGNIFLHQLIMRGGAVAMTDAEIAACRRLCAAKAGVSL